MKTRAIFARIIERIFPEQTTQIRNERLEKRTAMQKMLDASRKLNEYGWSRDGINEKMAECLRLYGKGSYKLCVLNLPVTVK